MENNTDAKLIFYYMKLNMPVQHVDLIICLGSAESRVAHRAAELMLEGVAPKLIVSGGLGKLTKTTSIMSEAERFKSIVVELGVEPERILVEDKATNTGQNALLSYEVAVAGGLTPKSILIVTKPYMERRAYATFCKQWPGEAEFTVTSPNITFEESSEGDTDKDTFISLMVGDLQRIKINLARGFQIEQDIPEEVWAAYGRLVGAGFGRYLES
jgi:uncharacterized SAM-binding protein YcdF (DUF218 family)